MSKTLRTAFMAGYESELGDMIPVEFGLGSSRESYLIGAYFMRAKLTAPKRIELGPWKQWEGGNGFAYKKVQTIFVDGKFYANVPCAVGTKTITV